MKVLGSSNLMTDMVVEIDLELLRAIPCARDDRPHAPPGVRLADRVRHAVDQACLSRGKRAVLPGSVGEEEARMRGLPAESYDVLTWGTFITCTRLKQTIEKVYGLADPMRPPHTIDEADLACLLLAFDNERDQVIEDNLHLRNRRGERP